jgi:hypothetical protein
VYSQYAKRRLENNEVVIYSFSLLQGDCDGVREVLSKSRINAKMHESQGFLLLLLLLLPLLMDSYKMMMYLHAQQYENELLFNRL